MLVVKTQDGSGEKSGKGADGVSASFNSRYIREGMGPVKFCGGKEGIRVYNYVFYHCILRVSVRLVGPAHCNRGLEYVLEGNSKSSYPTHDDDAQRKVQGQK